MKNKSVRILLILLTLACILPAGAQRVVKVGAFNFYPGIFQDSDGKVKGFYIDALNEIAQKENITFEYVYGSWNDGLERMENGEIDMYTSVAYSAERASYMDYASRPLLTVWGEVYTTPASQISGILDLENRTIAVMKGDMNGRHLTELTRKLGIPCNYLETADFDEVFRWIESGKVDAGVVNNTFGASKYHEYKLRSSGIVFNPFEIFFTVTKNTNRDLLRILNTYLDEWEHDPNSVYNQARQKWSHGKIGSIAFFPAWIKKTIYAAGVLILMLILFVLILRYKVKAETLKVQNSEALFKVFMENLPAFVYIKDERLKHIYVNKRVENVTSQSDPDGASSAQAIFEAHVADMLEETDRKVLQAGLKQIDIQYFCKLKEQEAWLHDYKFYLKLPDGKPAIGGISFDITAIKQAEHELIKAKMQAEESDRLKSAFLANMSHEIRTPLNSIIGFSELLADPAFDAKQKTEFSQLIISNGTNLLNIISDILDISKMESGEIAILKTKVQVRDFMNEMRAMHCSKAREKSIQIKSICHCTDSDPVRFVLADKDRLQQVFNNLISNALKFTPEGFVELGCVAAGGVFEFYVKDSGIGISPEYHEKIFNRFVQIETPYSRKFGGNGLGLAITRNLIERMGGTIRLESEPGKGSTFYFTLPAIS